MSTTLLSQDIVKLRTENAPRLEKLRDSADKLIHQLKTIKNSPLVEFKPTECDKLVGKLRNLRGKLDNKYQLFNSGIITISVAGIEKSGKTTLLKNLTGIDNLPTADERCTSVSCEIIYVESRDKERIEISYYTQEQLLQIIQHQLDYIKNAGNLWKEGCQFDWNAIPEDIDDFTSYTLPHVDIMDAAHRSKYKSTLEQLSTIKNNLKNPESKSKLGTTYSDSLENLPQYASHKTATNDVVNEHQSIIRKISIYKNYEGGSSALRLNDTPGVDAPNPHAFAHTIKSIQTETDLLVIANRPALTPDITESMANFLSRLSNLDPASPLRKRSIFFVNWQRNVDPKGINAQIRINKVKDDGTFPDDCIYGPCDIMEKSELKKFMDHMVNRLRHDIPDQDKSMIDWFESEWKDIRDEVHTHIYKPLHGQMPPLPEQQRWQLADMYDRWFEKRNDTEHADTSVTKYFFDCLKTGMGNKTETCTQLKAIEELNDKVKQICKEEMCSIIQWLSQRANEEKIQEMIKASNEPWNTLLPELGEMMTKIVENLTSVAENISPVIQDEVYEAIKAALQNTAVAEQLCPGEKSGEKLMSLCNKMREHTKDDDVKFIVSGLEEIANNEIKMRFLMRHELRPALNLFDPHRWTGDRHEVLIESVATALRDTPYGNKCISWMKGNDRIPSIADKAEKHHIFYENLCKVCFHIIHGVMLSNANKFEDLVQDFMADASQTLSTQRRCRNGWNKGLRPFINIIFKNEYEKMEKNQANAEKYKCMLDELNKAIG